MLGRLIFSILIVFLFVNADKSEASTYITKKSDTSKIVEKIEKEYAAGKISKSECVKKKSKALKLGKVSKTICDNVEVKTVKKETKEEKKVEYIKKKEKKKKKDKKEFLKKTKDLSKKAKSWITKKVKKEKKHFKTIAQLPKADFYFTATDDKGNTFIGYTKLDKKSTSIKIGNKTIYTEYNGKAFQDDAKTQCNVDTEVVSKVRKGGSYTATVIVKCENNERFVGSLTQTGNEGFGEGRSDSGTKLYYTFSTNRHDAVASLKEKKKEGKELEAIAQYEEKNNEKKDTIKPVIKISYDNKTYASSKNEKIPVVEIESSDINYEIKGKVYDQGGSVKKFLVNGKTQTIKEDGSFKIKRKSKDGEELRLLAYDDSGNDTEMVANIKITAEIFDNKRKYFALLIGNNKYKYWSSLESPITDVNAIEKILEEKYKFEVTTLKDATKNEIVDALWDMDAKLKKYYEKTQEPAYLLIYYAGHGDKNESGDRAYWIPIEAKEDDKRNWISTTVVKEHMEDFKARHILLMVDSCFAGLTNKKGNTEFENNSQSKLDDTKHYTKMLNTKTRLIMTSGGNSPVEDTSDTSHSWFAKNFINTLNENNSHIKSIKVFENIQRYVLINADSQRPQWEPLKGLGHAFGDFIFSVRN